ncbi:sulfatase-like hydrolase/transferase [Aeromonas jandaei]|uniref:alkaline phosphatase n=1 Tax=Aeromonas jandaei TaxID=650 RepID=UPI0019316DA3|nr:alkaline phosphatase [Aeromonas jandaei]MBM0491695.1 sulfatase-like hydrolase/transferase [Aeromonas jandaei]MBM0568922.1 sulfatase-like hydrolase/transferase [Aeromonas jandaei]
MKKMAGVAVMMGAALVAGCNSENNSQENKPGSGARNVIFFLGDGMGLNTLTAARIYGVGEEGSLTIDTLPETAFIKTFSHDSQVTDSAPSMSAYMTGVKSNNGVISMDSNATQESNCSKSAGKPATTLLELAKAAGRGTGVVTTTRVTHATPAATYAHLCNRDLEADIAAQLVPGGAGYNSALKEGVDVVLGGGSSFFRPLADKGKREDGRNLINEMKAKGYQFASNLEELNKAEAGKPLLGLFGASHMKYDLDRPASEPSLAQMTLAAIKQLKEKKQGYFLMVEGGRIDHALHDTNAKRALQDTLAFDNAIKATLDEVKKTDPELKNTLIVVTADHDHTLVLNGYAKRTGKTTADNPGVLGLVKNYETGEPSKDADGMPYTIIGFGNGYNRVDGPRSSVAPLDDATVSANDYHQEVVVKVGEIGNETHGGTDVFLGAIGRGADSFHGSLDNTAVFGKVKAAAGL